MKSFLCFLGVVTFLVSSTAKAEMYPPLDNGMVTKNSILNMHKGLESYLQNEVNMIHDEKERARAVNNVKGWLKYLSPYVKLAGISTIEELESLYPKGVSWIAQEGNLSYYYYVLDKSVKSQFRAVLYRKNKDKLSFETVLYTDTYVNYEFAPKIYHRRLNDKPVLLIHLHGVVSGQGLIDDENLFVLGESGTLSKVDVSKMNSQVGDSLKKGCYLKGHSRLSEEVFIYFGEERCLVGDLVAAHFELKNIESGNSKYSLEIIPSTFGHISRETASELFAQ